MEKKYPECLLHDPVQQKKEEEETVATLLNDQVDSVVTCLFEPSTNNSEDEGEEINEADKRADQEEGHSWINWLWPLPDYYP